MKKNLFAFLFIILLFIQFNCGSDSSDSVPPRLDTTTAKDTIPPEPEFKINYTFLNIEGIKTLEALKDSFGVEGRYTILALNRLDTRNFPRRDSLIVPDTIFTDFLKYSPFPHHVDLFDSIKKILLFDQSIQAFAAYEYGGLVKWGPTSTGKKSTPTPNGLYHTNWKAKVTRSTIDSTWILPWAFNLENRLGISLHQFDMPGYPASHACARLLRNDAEWIYYWAEQWILTKDERSVIAYGTPVIIYGDYTFGSPRPWRLLADNPDANDVSAESIEKVAGEYYQIILSRQAFRDSLIEARNTARDSLAVEEG